MARARTDLGEEMPIAYDPALPVQLHDPYELEALGGMLRAIKEAALNLRADGADPWTDHPDGFPAAPLLGRV